MQQIYVKVFFLGLLSGLVFAPVFFFPGLLTLAFLCYYVQICNSYQQAALTGFIFGFGHFLISMYWISIGVSVYIEEFWWVIPFALFGLPIILACFISVSCLCSFFSRNHSYYQFIFCTYWVLFEWIRSWIFTGLPWNLIGYSLSFSDILIQPVSIIGIYGLSFLTIYISTSFYPILAKKSLILKILLINSVVIILSVAIFGKLRLYNNPTNLSDVKVRLVQPSIPQIAKWDAEEFWKNLNLHIKLSQQENAVDLIIWSEAALVVPYNYKMVQEKLLQMMNITNAKLITGGISSNEKEGDDLEIYTSMLALQKDGSKLFEYHKSHLVPFGEYMPLKWLLPIKKLTPGFMDYTEGNEELVMLDEPKIKIKPLICYESIFPDLVRTSNKDADMIINITNDTWYGNSSGPYQHFQISRMRSVENGLPLIRVANNGISAIIDPVGRVISKLNLNKIGFLDGAIPQKLKNPTIYSCIGNISVLIAIIIVLIINYLTKRIIKIA